MVAASDEASLASLSASSFPLMLACPGVQEMFTVVFLFSKCCICCLISATVCLCCVGCHPNFKMPIADWLSEKYVYLKLLETS